MFSKTQELMWKYTAFLGPRLGFGIPSLLPYFLDQGMPHGQSQSQGVDQAILPMVGDPHSTPWQRMKTWGYYHTQPQKAIPVSFLSL